MAAERAEILIGCYRRDDAHNPEIYARAVVSVLMRYPESIVLAVTEPATGLPSRLKWLPQIAELVEACEDAYAPIARRLERDRAAQRALPAPQAPRRTLEQQQAIDRQVELTRLALGIPTKGYPRTFRPIGDFAGASRQQQGGAT